MAEEIVLLAIESSCDETSAAVLIDGKIKSNIIATQKVHEAYGGVVPELASRAHLQNIIPIVDVAIKEAGITKKDIKQVAFTQSPGLIGSLLVGAGFAKGFAQSLKVPLIAVPHIKAHILAHFIDDPQPEFPFLCLTVSGGHTQLVICHNHLHHEIIGTTKDDAAGEAFDKISKMIGLPYPGGPILDKYAQEGSPLAFKYPIGNQEGYNFSFSGLKTAVLYHLQKELRQDKDFVKANLKDICASVQYTIIETLLIKVKKAVKEHGIKHVGIAGGVSANRGLRKGIVALGDEIGFKAYIPKFEYCTDNAAMIAMTAYYMALEGYYCDLSIVPSARS
jgi:N6-L-threonylcarbamoyladenine synthase